MANEELRRIKTYVGATGRKLRFQMRDLSTGAAYDMSGASGVTISARKVGSVTYKIQAATMTVEAGTSGWVYFYPTAGECDTKGEYRGMVRWTGANGTEFSDRVIIEIEEPDHYTA